MSAKTAIISGAGSGIGYAIAEAFIREGSNVVLNGRTEDKLTRAAAQLDRPGNSPSSQVTLPARKRPIAFWPRPWGDSAESTSSSTPPASTGTLLSWS